MFFVAFFGIQNKDKQIGTYKNAPCPICERGAEYEIHKSYSYFHIFLLPLFKWNVKYLIKTACCNGVYELDPEVGREFEKNPGITISKDNLKPLNNSVLKYCVNCKAYAPAEFNYCPYCGGRL